MGSAKRPASAGFFCACKCLEGVTGLRGARVHPKIGIKESDSFFIDAAPVVSPVSCENMNMSDR